MTAKRKRTGLNASLDSPQKRARFDSYATRGQRPSDLSKSPSRVRHALLALYYPRLLTLRSYLLYKLPETSKTRRRRIAEWGSNDADGDGDSHILDTTIVGVLKDLDAGTEESRRRDFAVFTQTQQRSSDGSHDSPQTGSFAEASC